MYIWYMHRGVCFESWKLVGKSAVRKMSVGQSAGRQLDLGLAMCAVGGRAQAKSVDSRLLAPIRANQCRYIYIAYICIRIYIRI